MRRALLTVRSAPPLTVGNTGTFGASGFAVRTAVAISDPATASGTVTTVTLGSMDAGNVLIMVGSLAGSNFTVRSISPALVAIVGLNTFTVSLPILAGDVIGHWYEAISGDAQYGTQVGAQIGYSFSQNSAPVVGTVIALTTEVDARLALRGTG